MNTAQIAELFKQYVDDSDLTFMDDATKVNFLNLGWRELTFKAAESDSNLFGTSQNYININADTLDLAAPGATGNAIMGSAPVADRLYRLMRVARSDAGTGLARYYLQASNSLVEMRNGVNRYMLRGTQLLFSEQADSCLVEYVGFPTEPFTVGNTATGGGVYLNEIATYYGDLIALMACKHYQIKDFAANPVLMAQLAMRKNELDSYLMTGRSWNQNNNVVGTDEATYY